MAIFKVLHIPFETNLSIILSKLQFKLNVKFSELLSHSNVVFPQCPLKKLLDVLKERM